MIESQRDIDAAIKARLASNWKLERIDATLRALLRSGAWELMKHPETPREVVIDEYVELAKAFLRRRRGALRQRRVGRRGQRHAQIMPALDVAGEFETIERLLKPLAHPEWAGGLMDDVAVLPSRPGHDLILTKDAMVEGVHFLPDDPLA